MSGRALKHTARAVVAIDDGLVTLDESNPTENMVKVAKPS